MANKNDIDSILAYVLMKSVLTNPQATDAYALGLIDEKGTIIKEPETDEEKESLTVLDKLGFKLRRMLGSRISELSSFAYVKSIPEKYQYQMSTNSVEKKAMVKRVTAGIENLTESQKMSFDEIVKVYLNESLKEK
jgi:hypothetical protein